jgi:CMP-N-acetylneuraminic acid synthetase
MFVGIIPAKLNSRRLERKNVKILGDLPLLAYTLRAAFGSRSLDRVIVSTDSDFVEELALQHSEERLTVLRRASKLSGELTTVEAVLLDVADRLEFKQDDVVVTLLPTSPFRSRDLIDRCIRLFQSRQADTVLTVQRRRLKLGTLEDDRAFRPSRHYPPEMHRVEPVFIDNPAVYVTRLSALRGNRFVLGDRCYGVEIDRIEGHDINEPLDWLIAEAVLENGLFTPPELTAS